MLYIVSTPIGNLKDISLRMIEVFKVVDFIVAEDTRTTGKLLKHLNIHKRMISYNDHNKKQRTKTIIQKLKDGNTAALVSENGTPCISDPGFYLVRQCVNDGIKLVPVPGASSFLAALVASGLPTDRFQFLGFMPKGPGKKERLIREALSSGHTFVFYESPHRILKSLELLKRVSPNAKVAVCRELTKKFEEIIRGSPVEALERLEKGKPRGEFTVVVHE